LSHSPLKTTFAIVAVCILAAAQTSAETNRNATLKEMRKIFVSIKTLLPLSVDDEAFRSEDNREEIQTALKKLASHAGHVSGHIAGDDRRIRFRG
jgi:hypothetical protein